MSTVAVGQVWVTRGERWRVEEREPYGDPGTYLMRALDGPHEGHTDTLFGAEVIRCATLEETHEKGPEGSIGTGNGPNGTATQVSD